jgi:HlyD family secretion protein
VPVVLKPVVRSDLLVRVQCDGRLEPPEGGELRTADGGTVAAIAVHEGDRVRRGQLLLRLSNPDLEARARDALGEVRQLQSDTAAALGELDRDRREAEWRERVVAGDRRLVAQKAIPPATLDADQLAWQQALDRVRDAQARLDALHRTPGAGGGSAGARPDAAGAGDVGRRPQEARGAGGGPAADGRPDSQAIASGRAGRGSRLALSQSAAAELTRRLGALTVRAPFDGLVYGLPHAAGETVPAGQLVASVTDPDHPHVRCRVDQPDLPRVAPGQRLIVTFNGLPDSQWEGTVERVGTGLREAGGREVGELVGQLADPVHTLPANAAVDVQVVVAQKRGVLTVPRSALRREGGDSTGAGGEQRYVYAVVRRRSHRRDVKVGLIGLSEVEILSGLGEGERVVAEGPPSLEDGTRVTETKAH